MHGTAAGGDEVDLEGARPRRVPIGKGVYWDLLARLRGVLPFLARGRAATLPDGGVEGQVAGLFQRRDEYASGRPGHARRERHRHRGNESAVRGATFPLRPSDVPQSPTRYPPKSIPSPGSCILTDDLTRYIRFNVYTTV